MKTVIALCIFAFVLAGVSETIAVEAPLKFDTEWIGDFDRLLSVIRLKIPVDSITPA